MKNVSSMFSQADLARIQDAVKEAEGKTSGEIVPYVVEMSDTYEVAEWRAGVLAAVVAFGAFAGVRQFTDAWLPLDFIEMTLIVMLASAAGAFVTHFVAGLQRLFAGKHLMKLRAHQRAMQAFVSEEVFATRARSGILIFLSTFERMVVVLGDSGINAKVQQSDWDGVVNTIVSAVKEGRPADGLVEAIEQSGKLLERHGVTRKPDDKDELRDNLRMEDR